MGARCGLGFHQSSAGAGEICRRLNVRRRAEVLCPPSGRTMSLIQSLSGVTCLFAMQMSAFDPKRTSCGGAKYQNLHTIDPRRKPPGARCSDAVKACNGSRVAKTSKLSTAVLQEQVAALTRFFQFAREQQTATSEVLQVRSCGVAVSRGLPRFFAVE